MRDAEANMVLVYALVLALCITVAHLRGGVGCWG